MKLLCTKIKSHVCLEMFQSMNDTNRRGHGVLFQAGLLIFCAVSELRNSGKSAKSRKIRQNTKNTVKFSRNLIKYMSVQRIWNLFRSYWDYLLAINLHSFLRTSSLKRANNIPKTTRRRLCCEKLGISHDVRGLVHFCSVLLLKEQMMTSVRKMLKTLVWSVQNRLISSEICLKNNHQIGRFLPIAFCWSLPEKLPWNYCEIGGYFREFVPKNPAKFDFFFCDLSEAQSMPFWKPKNAEEGRKLIENGTPKSTIPLKKYSLKTFFWNGWMVGKQKSSTRALRIDNW